MLTKIQAGAAAAAVMEPALAAQARRARSCVSAPRTALSARGGLVALACVGTSLLVQALSGAGHSLLLPGVVLGLAAGRATDRFASRPSH